MQREELVMTIARDLFSHVKMPGDRRDDTDQKTNDQIKNICKFYKKMVEEVGVVYDEITRTPDHT